MISKENFRIEVGYSERGPVVTVTHLPTGTVKEWVCGETERVGAVRDRLLRELVGEIYDPSEFRVDLLNMGPGEGCRVRVVHEPSGKSRVIEAQDHEAVERATCEIVEELLREAGRLPRPTGGDGQA